MVGHVKVDAPQDLDGSRHRVALVARVVLPADVPVGVQDDGLDGRRPGVDAQEAVGPGDAGAVAEGVGVVAGGRGGPAGARNGGAGVAGAEGRQFVGVGEQGAHAGGGQVQGCAGGQTRGQFGEAGRLAGGHEGGADGDVELGVVGAGEGVDLVGQGALEGGAQLGQEVEGAAQEHDVAADGAPAGQARDGLGDDGLEDGGGQVLPGGALVDQRLEVGLGEDAAARGDGVEGLVARGELVQARGVGVQELGHLVDEGARAARAGAVHALFGSGVQVGEFGVLAAQFDDDIDLGVQAPGGLRARDDLLDEGDAHRAGSREAARARDGADDLQPRVPSLDVGQEAAQLRAHVGVVAAVVGVEDAVAVEDHGLDRGGSDVDAELVDAPGLSALALCGAGAGIGVGCGVHVCSLLLPRSEHRTEGAYFPGRRN